MTCNVGHHDYPLMSVEMTDTFCSFYNIFHFCQLFPFAKIGQYEYASYNVIVIHCNSSLHVHVYDFDNILVFLNINIRWGIPFILVYLMHFFTCTVYRVTPPKKKKKKKKRNKNNRNSRFFRTLLSSTVIFFHFLDRASFPHYNNTKIIKCGWALFILSVISYGLSFLGFAINS